MSHENEIHKLTLGPEWDAKLQKKLFAAVKTLGGTIVESSWGVGGSQEVTEYSITLPDAKLTAACETYVGLQLHGPRTAVDRLVAIMDETR